MSPLSARDRRALRLGSWIVLPALAWSLLVRPGLSDVDVLRDTLAAERPRLQRERGAIAALEATPAVRTSTATPDSLARALRPRLFTGRDDVIASAALAAYVGEVAEAHDVLLQSATTRPTTRGTAGVRAVHVEVRAEGDITGLVRFLDALERGLPLVQVQALEVETRARTEEEDGPEPLALRATITGYADPVDMSATRPRP
jgi:hypothetical protein